MNKQKTVKLKNVNLCRSLTRNIYSVKKVAPLPKKNFFCDIFTSGEPVQLKIIMAIAQTYFYIYTNFDPFILIYV